MNPAEAERLARWAACEYVDPLIAQVGHVEAPHIADYEWGALAASRN
jgi:hypothetical protein